MKSFGNIAVQLARNPLGIIALAFVLVYGIASLVTTQGSLQIQERIILIYFLALFPVLVFLCFMVLVIFHHEKLYAPSDYKDESLFGRTFLPQDAKDAAAEVKQKPDDIEAKFTLIDKLLKEDIKQHLMLMFKCRTDLPIDVKNQSVEFSASEFISHTYEFLTRADSVHYGNFHPWKFTEQLKGTGLVNIDQRNSTIQLSGIGMQFAEWMERNNKDAKIFWTSDGKGWGEHHQIQEMVNQLLSLSSSS